MLKKKILNHPDWKVEKAASMMFEDKTQKQGDYAVFCRSPMAEYSGYQTVNLEQMLIDIDGRIFSPAVKMMAGMQWNDAIAWASWEKYSSMLDTLNALQKSARVMDREFVDILRGVRKPRTKADIKKLQGAFNRIIAVLGE